MIFKSFNLKLRDPTCCNRPQVSGNKWWLRWKTQKPDRSLSQVSWKFHTEGVVFLNCIIIIVITDQFFPLRGVTTPTGVPARWYSPCYYNGLVHHRLTASTLTVTGRNWKQCAFYAGFVLLWSKAFVQIDMPVGVFYSIPLILKWKRRMDVKVQRSDSSCGRSKDWLNAARHK